MVGGNVDDYESSKEYLQCMGTNIIHCGHAGTGQVAKVCNNLALGTYMQAYYITANTCYSMLCYSMVCYTVHTDHTSSMNMRWDEIY